MNGINAMRLATSCAIAILVALVTPIAALAQQETAVWHFGTRIGLDFNIPPATPAGPVQIGSAITSSEGTAVVSDRVSGQTLFYTNGLTVWDRNGNPMPNAGGGAQLGGGNSSTQAALVVQDLANPNRYYLFTTPNLGTGIAEYSIVDMTLNGGAGSVDPAARRIPLPTIAGVAPPANVAEKVAATRDAAGTGYWVVFHETVPAPGSTNRFFAYHVSATGIDNVVVSNAGTPIVLGAGGQNARGELKFSPDGRWLATANEALVAELFRFNNATGAVTFAVTLTSGEPHYGVSFSPNSRLLYINNGWSKVPGIITQFDLGVAPASIPATGITIGTSAHGQMGAMQIAPDGRIYVAKYSANSLGAINCPDVRGVGANYVDAFMTLNAGTSSSWGLPNLILESVATPVYAGQDDTLCAGESTVIGATARQGFTYSWAPATGLDNATVPQPTASPAATTRYIVTVTSPASCVSYDTVNITVNSQPAATVSPDTAICLGMSARLRASGGAAGATYTWTPATDLDNPASATPIASPTATTTYQVLVTNPEGCRDSAQVTVTVNAVPSATISADATICEGTSTQLLAGGGTTYAWSPATGLSSTTIANPVASPAATTTYRVIVTNASGCADTANVTVTVNPSVSVAVSNDTTICSGNIAQLVASGGTSYSWSPATGLSDASIANPIATPPATTTYRVIASNGFGCADTASVTVNVNPTPTAVVSADTTICAGNIARLTAGGGTIYRWSPSTGLSDTTSPTPTASPTATTTYRVIVENSSGCRDTAQVTVTVQTASFSIAIPDTVGDPHDKSYRLPVRLLDANVPGECAPVLDDVTLSFDEDLFFPTGVTRGRIASNTTAGGIRTIVIAFDGAASLDSTLLTEVLGAVLLGDTIQTAISIDSVRWSNAMVTTSTTGGRLRLSPICEEGGPRLLRSRTLTIVKVAPNPTRDAASVELVTSSGREAQLDLYSAESRVFTTSWTPATAAGEYDLRTIQLPAGLPSGAYRVVLRSAGEVTTTLLIVTR